MTSNDIDAALDLVASQSSQKYFEDVFLLRELLPIGLKEANDYMVQMYIKKRWKLPENVWRRYEGR